MADKLKHSNKARDWWIPNKILNKRRNRKKKKTEKEKRKKNFTDAEGQQLESNEADSSNKTYGFRLESPCGPTDNKAAHGAQVESLWDSNN